MDSSKYLLSLAVVEGQYGNLGGINAIENQIVEEVDNHAGFLYVDCRHIGIAGFLPFVTEEKAVRPAHAFHWWAITSALYAAVVFERVLVDWAQKTPYLRYHAALARQRIKRNVVVDEALKK